MAGPKPIASTARSPIGPLSHDPWASYTGPKYPAQVASANATPTTASVGPTEQQLTQQADRISKLEDAVQQMQLTAANQTASIETLQLDNHKRDVAIRSHIDERMNGIKQELNQSFAEALKMQSQQFSSNLDEIKNLLREKPKRKQPERENADMSD